MSPSSSKSSELIGESLEIAFGLNAISALCVWDVVFDQLIKRSVSSETIVDLYGRRVTLDKMHAGIRKANRGHFGIDLDSLSIHYGPIANKEHALLIIKDSTEFTDPKWDRWANAFLSYDDFMQAWVVNNEYDHWQNAHDPIQYTVKGRSYAGLPMKSNDLPPPLEQMIIDTSNNPGRRIIRMGYVEAIGSPMWLGRLFWERTGANKKSVMDAFAKDAQLLENDVVRIQVSDKPFTENADPALQNRLRHLLYPSVA